MRLGLPVLVSLLAAVPASAGDTTLQNDSFVSGSAMNASVFFGEFEGAAVWLQPDGGYPLTIKAVDVLCAPSSFGSAGAIGAYLLDVWDERAPGGNHPPSSSYGNRVSSASSGIQLTAQTGAFNRFTLNPPLVLDSGSLFIAIREQTSSATDGTTIALDTSPSVPGGNWFWNFAYYAMPDAGTGVAYPSGNWLIRAVVQGQASAAPTVTAIAPNEAAAGTSAAVVITGTGFDLSSTATVGGAAVTVTALNPPTEVRGTVSPSLAPGVYDVTVTNGTSGLSGTLPRAFTVRLADGGLPPPPDSGTGGGTGLALDSVDPTQAFNGEDTQLTLLGSGFAEGAVVLVGTKVLDATTRKNSAVMTAVVPKGFAVGTWDVSVVNPDGAKATLKGALTVVTGVSVKSGCGCQAPGASEALSALGVLALFARRRRATSSPR